VGVWVVLRTRLRLPFKVGALGAAVVAAWLLGGLKRLLLLVGLEAQAKLPALAGFDAKFWGVVIMGGAVIVLFFLPWLDRSPAKSIRYRPNWHFWLYMVFVIVFGVLGYLGIQPPSPVGERLSQLGTLFYFGFFFLMPWWSQLGQFKPVPDRVTYQPH
jgi:ubiquinol-cytochrome c reductase cytochrome b subunit